MGLGFRAWGKFRDVGPKNEEPNGKKTSNMKRRLRQYSGL